MGDLISRQAAIDTMSESLKRVFPEHRQIAEKCLNALPSAQPEFTNEEIRLTLKQLRVYFAIKIRDGKDGSVPAELSQRVEEIQKYFENVSSAQPEIIRCKDCKHWKSDEFIGNNDVSTINLQSYPCKFGITDAEWYCAYAERRQDD